MRFDGILCDLDGTLVDSEAIHLEAWNSVIVRGGHMPSSDWNDECIGLPDYVASNKILRLYPGVAELGDIRKVKADTFLEMAVSRAKELIFPGVREKLVELSEAGIPLAVCTNSIMRNTRAVLEASELIGFFAALVTIDAVSEGKPHPAIYRTGAAKLGLAPDRCLVVEDSAAGIASGKAAGCGVVAGVTNTWNRDKLPGADMYFSDTPSALSLVLDGKAAHVE